MKLATSITQSFSVNYDYKLYFTEQLFAANNTLLNDVLKEYKSKGKVKMLFVLDSGVVEHHSNIVHEIEEYCDRYSDTIAYTGQLVILGGEACKNDYESVDKVLKAISDNGICRHSFVVAIGGGAVIDMVGYAAAIAHRGVKLIRVPTTVLSQNDSAVGVKNSINIFEKKNFLGTFAPPYAILNDLNFLRTLAQRDWISGIAEAVKVSLIKDESFFDFIDQNATKLFNREMEPMQYLIYRCAQMHMQHIAQGGDPFESGSSRPLDFGHWAAHKLEHMTNYRLRHGEAVAIGMALDVAYAYKTDLIDKSTLERVVHVLEEVGFDVQVPLQEEKDIDRLLDGIEEFREHLGGELTITLITKIGEKHDVHEIDMCKMREAILLLSTIGKQKIVK